MGVLGDTLDEFKQAKTPEKVFIVGGGVAVVAIMLYVHSKSSAATPTQGATGAGLTGGGTGGGIQTVPTGGGGQVPILPPGLQPLYDALGNLIGYQPITSPGTPNSGSGTGTGTVQTNSFNPYSPQLPYGTKVPTQSGSLFAYNGTTYTIVQGPGRTWGAVGKMSLNQAQNTPIGAGKYLLSTSNQSAYTNVPQGGGPYGTAVLGKGMSRIAPTREGQKQYTHATKIMAYRRGRMRG